MTIKVTVSNGTYSCQPDDKAKQHGNGKITWKLQTKGFHFVSPGVTWGTPIPSTAPAPSDVFDNLDIKDDEITVDDNNRNPKGGLDNVYPYTLSIAVGDKSQALEQGEESNFTLALKYQPTNTVQSIDEPVAQALLLSSDPIIRNKPGGGA